VRHSARFRKMHDEVIAEFRPRAEAALSFIDKTVKDRPFLLGDACTIADICFTSGGPGECPDWGMRTRSHGQG
jgi:glutathione S-transferase